MSTTTPPARRTESDALLRRTRYATATVVLLTAVTAVALFCVVLAARYHTRYDVTSTREHTLSPRTLGVLKNLSEPTSIVVSADVRQLDPRAWQMMSDLLSEFAKSSKNLEIATIDAGSSTAGAQVDAVVTRLAKRDVAAVKEHNEVLQRTEDALAGLPGRLVPIAESLAGAARALPQGDPSREPLEQSAAAIRVATKDLAAAADRVKALRHGAPLVAGLDLPESDTVQQAAMPPLDATVKSLAGAGQLVAKLAAPSSPELVRAISALQDDAALAFDRLRSLKALEPVMIARLLRAQQAVLIFSDKGTTAIDFEAIFPQAAQSSAEGQAAAQVLFAGEELLATAVASLALPVKPILVLVHAEKERLIDDRGGATPYAAGAMSRLIDRFRLRKVDVAEWATAIEPVRPALTSIDPAHNRPRVWFVMPAPARTNLDPKRGTSLAERAARVGKLADALKVLLETGDPVLAAIEPSELPAVGEPDPLAEPLKALGMNVDVGHPLLERISTPRGPAISCYQSLTKSEIAHPIGQAIDGLTTMLHWAMPITLADPAPAGVHAQPILRVPASDAVWGESQWLPFRYANARQPFQALAPAGADMPTPDASRDVVKGPWIVAAVAERDRPNAAGNPQRVMVVASPSWYEDLYTQASNTVDGRRAWLFPGNSELFEAGFAWLAGLDDLIAASPRIRDVARIEPMPEGRLALIRWTLIAGLPLLVLAVGFAVRVLRG